MNDDRHRDPWPACHRRPIRRNARGFGRGGGGGPVPAPALPLVDMILGYEARDGVLDINGEIASVPDLSGHGNTISAVGALGSRPGSVADADYGGQRVATLSGAAGEAFARATFTQGAEPQPTTHYWLGELGSLATNQFLFDGDATHRQFLHWNASSQRLEYFAGVTVDSGRALDVNTPVVICVIFDGALSELFVDDFAEPVHEGNPGTNGISMYEAGVRSGGTMSLMNGRWAASYAYAAAHDASQRAAVAAYITHTFSLQIDT